MSQSGLKITAAGLLAVIGVGVASAEPPPDRKMGRDPAAVAAAIDREVTKRLAEAKVPASPPADDAEFLRRVTLDLTGRIPTRTRAAAFLDDPSPDKRRRLIDELLDDPNYGHHFGTVWRNRIAPPSPVKTKGRAAPDPFGLWLAEQFNRNRGWDQIVRDLLTAEGDIAKNPATRFVTANSSENFQPRPALLAGAAARLFLGVQLRCAECHDHPFAAWKQTDFWGTAAFFSRLRNTSQKGPPFVMTEAADPNRPGDESAGAAIAIPAESGKAVGKVVKARFLGGREPPVGVGPLRPTFAEWVTAPENPYFANALVNRLWAQLFGRGLVNPVDDLRDENPPSHPELLKLLADEFRASGYDLKHLARCITLSGTYQRTSRPQEGNAADHELFSHMAIKALSPEAFYDSLMLLMAVDKKSKLPFAKGNWPQPSHEGREEFVRFFRAQGESAGESAFSHGIPHFLKRLNGDMFNAGAPFVAQLAAAGLDRRQMIENIYLATLARQPTGEEVGLMTDYLSRRSDANEGYVGVFWILLNSGEFILNH